MAAPAEPAATNERERESDDAKAIDSPSPSDTPSPIDSPKDKDSSPKEDSEEMVGKEKSVSDGAESSDAADEKRRARSEDENVVADLSDPASATTATVDCPPSFVGRVIGKGGETIKGLQAQSGAHITIDQNFPEGVPRKISISGPSGCVTIAVRLIEELLTGNGGRAFGGGASVRAKRGARCGVRRRWSDES
jgi:far upstream element-binding protein